MEEQMDKKGYAHIYNYTYSSCKRIIVNVWLNTVGSGISIQKFW